MHMIALQTRQSNQIVGLGIRPAISISFLILFIYRRVMKCVRDRLAPRWKITSAFPELTSSLQFQDPGLGWRTGAQNSLWQMGEEPARKREGNELQTTTCGASLLFHHAPVGGALGHTQMRDIPALALPSEQTNDDEFLTQHSSALLFRKKRISWANLRYPWWTHIPTKSEE